MLPAGQALEGDGVAVPVTIGQAQFALRPPREYVQDDAAPPLEEGANLRGGARLVEAQSDCPFKGMAMFRLGTETWPEAIDGLSALERGVLVHAALAAFWRVVKTHEALLALSPTALRSAITHATEEALTCLPSARWRVVSLLVQQGEGTRIESLLAKWLDDFERPRPPFTVSQIEAERSLLLAEHPLRLRLDRIDTLDDGGVAIIEFVVRSAAPRAAARALYARSTDSSSGPAGARSRLCTAEARQGHRPRARCGFPHLAATEASVVAQG